MNLEEKKREAMKRLNLNEKEFDKQQIFLKDHRGDWVLVANNGISIQSHKRITQLKLEKQADEQATATQGENGVDDEPGGKDSAD